MNSRLVKLGGLGILALALTGCPPKPQVKKPEEVKPEETQQATPQEEPSLRGKDYQEAPGLSVIYFDLDQATLRSDARNALQKNYETFQKHADWEILVEGHCDERGTTEYNLGLGQRRAAAVRQYYVSLGMAGNRVATISYGKENPACSEQTEDCWSKNRRGVTKARSVHEATRRTPPSDSAAPLDSTLTGQEGR
jgi:peptidoglycan-associated lipoprotein